MAKKIIRLTESELTNLIQRIVVETKYSEMDEMDTYDMEEGELDEGLFGPGSEEIEQRKNDLEERIQELLDEEGISEDELKNSVEAVLRRASENDYDGEVSLKTARRSGEPLLVYTPNPTRFERSKFYQNVMRPMVGGMRQGHKFGSGE